MKVGTLTSPVTFEELVEMADDAGVKLEITGGIPTWEAFPGPRHQRRWAASSLPSNDRPRVIVVASSCLTLISSFQMAPSSVLILRSFVKSLLIKMRLLKKSRKRFWKF